MVYFSLCEIAHLATIVEKIVYIEGDIEDIFKDNSKITI